MAFAQGDAKGYVPVPTYHSRIPSGNMPPGQYIMKSNESEDQIAPPMAVSFI